MRRAPRTHHVLVPTLTVLLVSACASPGPAGDPASSPAEVATTRAAVPERFPLPDVTKADHGQALKTLQDAGLVVRLRYVIGSAPTGQVVGTDPPAGAEVTVADVVVVEVAESVPDDAVSLLVLVGRHPEAFVGFAEESDGTVMVAVNRGTDLDTWRPRLDAAARGTTYRTRECGHTWTDLARVQALLSRRDWSPRATEIRFATSIDAGTCSVKLSSVMLTAEEIQQLRDRFGDALTIDPTSDPRRERG